MRIMVTGGAGFIGSALVRMLVREHGHNVLNIDILTYAASPEALEEVGSDSRYALMRVDICDRAKVAAAMAEFAPEAIVHLAAESHVDRSIDGPGAFVTTNVVGTYVMLDAALAYWRGLPAGSREAFRFVHVSTDEVYGSLGPEGRFTESSRYDPNSPYAASKAAADHFARAWHRTYGMPVILTNCSNNYGPYQFPEKLIPLTIIKAMAGESLPVYGSGDNVRDWIHVEDHARGILAALTGGRVGEGYNFGGASERRNIEVVRAICAAVDEMDPKGAPRERLITFVTDRPGHDARYAIDDSKARAELGWAPCQSFETGLAATVRWYAEHAAWWEPIRAGRYVGDRLGLGPAGCTPAGTAHGA
ncbi:MAG: dTDP-glucose 4,6-dehydratase [Geminicoccaceae bacterium]